MLTHRTASIADNALFHVALVLVAVGLLPLIASADTSNWMSNIGGNFTSSSNWSSGVPGDDDTAEFDRGAGIAYDVSFQVFGRGTHITNSRLFVGSNTVTFEGPRLLPSEYTVTQDVIIGGEPDDTAAVLNMNLDRMTAKTITLGYYYHDSNGTLNIAGNRELIINGASPLFNESLIVGGDGEGTLNISGGADVTLTGTVGDTIINQWGGGGTVNITGAGSTFSTPANLIVADLGFGFLNATSGAQVNSGNAYLGYATAQGEVSIDGVGTAWNNAGELHVGYSRNGLLEVTGGAAVTDDTAYVAYSPVSYGIVRVNGTGSTWTTRSLYVGHGSGFGGNQNIGIVEITGGGRLVSSSGGAIHIGEKAGATGTVKVIGPGSTWQSGAMYVGFGGEGNVQVLEGGQITGNGFLLAGYNAGSKGSVTIDGAGSTWTAYIAHLGYQNGHGSLSVTNGGQLSVDHASIGTPIAVFPGTGDATVDGASSTWTNTTYLDVGEYRSALLTITNGGTVTAGTLLTIGAFGEVRGDGNIRGNVQNGGLISPGTSPGALHIDGDYSETAGGKLLIELAPASTIDQLLVTGSATLAGTLTVNLMEGFAPDIGQAFTILTADVVNGTFTTETLPTVPNLRFDVTYNAQSVVVSVSSALPGDYNADGTVDAADYVAWRKNDGTQPGYDTWRFNFGKAIGSGATAGSAPPEAWSSSASVPEPATLILASLSAGFSLIVRQRRRNLNRALRQFWEV